MNKALSAVAMLLVLGLAFPAAAKDLNGRLGIGGAKTALHPGGLSLRYFVGHFGIQTILSHTYNGFQGDSNNTSRFLGELRAVFNAARAKDVNLYVAGGFGLGILAGEKNSLVCLGKGEDCTVTETSMEAAIGGEYFFSNYFSVSAEVGVPVFFVPQEGGVFDRSLGEGTYIRLGQLLTWGAAFSFLF